MFAIIRTGGKQYRVASGDVIRVEKLAGEPGDAVSLGDILMLGGDEPKTGDALGGASVAAEIVSQGRGDKIIVFKKKRRKNYRRTKGHRQPVTELRITDILADGQAPSKKGEAAEAKPRRAKTSDATARTDASEANPA